MTVLNSTGLEIKKQFEQNDAVCHKVISLFQLTANKTRFRIICTLMRDDFSVNEIAEIIGSTQLPNVSQQLKLLRLPGIIESRKESAHVIYKLRDEKVRKLIGFLQEEFLQTKVGI